MNVFIQKGYTMRTRFRFALFAFTGIALIIFFANVRAVSPRGEVREVIIEKGESVREIAVALHRAELIRSPNAFRLVSVFFGAADALKPGRYILSQASSTMAIINALAAGPGADERVLVVEGVTVKEIEEDLVLRRLIPAGALRALSPHAFSRHSFLEGASSLEGFLFPDTYHLSYGMGVEDIVDTFLAAFEKKAWPLIAARKDWREALIIASLVEKEVTTYEERRLVAGIIKKRLALGMPLQVDATIEYAKCRAFKDCVLTRSDYALVSPFNTYLRSGLPPGPIGNPGENAIRAALNPKASSYLYYLTDPKTKKAHFSETLDAHNEKRARYLRL